MVDYVAAASRSSPFFMPYVKMLTTPSTSAPAARNTSTTSMHDPAVEIKSSITTTSGPFRVCPRSGFPDRDPSSRCGHIPSAGRGSSRRWPHERCLRRCSHQHLARGEFRLHRFRNRGLDLLPHLGGGQNQPVVAIIGLLIPLAQVNGCSGRRNTAPIESRPLAISLSITISTFFRLSFLFPQKRLSAYRSSRAIRSTASTSSGIIPPSCTFLSPT